MPTKAKTWTHNANNRITFTTFADVHQQLLQAYKAQLKAIPGAVVKGSADATTAGMDGVDRIDTSSEWLRGTSTTAVHSWIVVTLGNMGGVDVLLEFVGTTDEMARIAFSPGGAYAVNGTNARYSPQAADEVIILNGASFGNTTTNGDRIWSAASASDGKAFFLLTARAGAWVTVLLLQEIQSAVVAPATFSPAVVGVAATSGPAITTWTSGMQWKGRVNGTSYGGALGFHTSMEAIANTMIPAVYTSVLELQASQWPIMSLGLWSQNAGARGKVGNLIDVWAGNTAASDGDTYPNDATRQFVAFGDYVLPWDGSTPVMS